jgi:NADPH-dependent 2,4-dienoyl-CoA reductase/sulfur reductase-like enzyme
MPAKAGIVLFTDENDYHFAAPILSYKIGPRQAAADERSVSADERLLRKNQDERSVLADERSTFFL